MRIKSIFIACALSLATISAAQAGLGRTPEEELQAAAKLASIIKERYPDIPPITSSATTPIPGLYEVLIGGKIAYTDESASYFVFNGTMVHLPTKTNITQNRLNELLKIDISSLDVKDAIIHTKGTGEHKLFVFSDPHCPYCHQLESELAKMENVTITTFMYPRPEARALAISIWCAEKPDEAWVNWMTKKTPPPDKTCENPIERNLALVQKIQVSSTPTLFAADGRRHSGFIPASEILKFLTNKK